LVGTGKRRGLARAQGFACQEGRPPDTASDNRASFLTSTRPPRCARWRPARTRRSASTTSRPQPRLHPRSPGRARRAGQDPLPAL